MQGPPSPPTIPSCTRDSCLSHSTPSHPMSNGSWQWLGVLSQSAVAGLHVVIIIPPSLFPVIPTLLHPCIHPMVCGVGVVPVGLPPCLPSSPGRCCCCLPHLPPPSPLISLSSHLPSPSSSFHPPSTP
ncbi:hypothetical protein L208DRAFT_122610 [Tricholoma matsutake]|nr:hypothetical protein L208DRAFT_122610 [Tricholoma matsutake 945]